MLSDLDLLARGAALGALAVTALGVWPRNLRQAGPVSTLLFCASAAAWVLSDAQPFSGLAVIAFLAFPAPGFFWLFIQVVFDDERVTARRLLPAALFLALGAALMLAPPTARGPLIALFNLAAALACLHAAYVVLSGWRQDLVELRRALRGVVLGAAALAGAGLGVAGLVAGPGRWAAFGWPAPYVAAAVSIALAAVSLQGRAGLFFPPRRPPAAGDRPLLTAAEEALLARLTAMMDEGAWRDEHLSLGGLTRSLGAPEPQVRRLINVALGHRNFAAFVNSYRVEAAKAELADPRQAGKTVAAIAFEVGYGSLSPFNRAFLAATGKTPTAWRRTMAGEED